MEKSTHVKEERKRLANKFNISESDIDLEIVPLMLTIEQSVTKIDQAAAKINDSVKPIVTNHHYNHGTSAWTVFAAAAGKNIAALMAVILVALLSWYGIHKFLTDPELIEQAELKDQQASYVLQHFTHDDQGNFYLDKKHYQVLPNKGIKLIMD
ncbi:MAG: hypothetical protein BGO21_30315 [Dyadobacter sp. 50-39]|uniref:hypothetical protein n=1 Tax=Dyadobacter sp. 50-39 TaxID=1895756 RepID=UPI00095E71FA|nr:hypothetical protein [Dyadobacter sp. 50-39]OJV22453.1 MAG: hypothetical protein BGO21_30315 [Dyadobacter sp. 50-39]